MSIKNIGLLCSLSLLTACQIISPVFVDYNGVRRDVATWINQQTLLSMQQKRSLAQLSKAQQKLVRIEKIEQQQKFEIAKENSIALHCAQQHLTAHKITQLQEKVFGKDQQQHILTVYAQQFPQLKLDVSQIKCE